MKDKSVRNNAFVATEFVALVVVAVVFVGVTIAASSDSRRLAMLNRDLANLRQIGAWTFAYGNDNGDLYPTLSSAPNSQWPKLRPTGHVLGDPAKHAIDIIRRRTGRVDFPLPSCCWIPHVVYSHLVLADYLDGALPDSRFVSSGDVHRMNWLDDPINKHDQGFWQPFQQPVGGTGAVPPAQKRWVYSSSYQSVPALYDQGQSQWSDPRRPVLRHGGSHNFWSVPIGVVLGGQNMSSIAFPAQKVMLFDYGSWYTSRRPQYFAVSSSGATTLMCDGGAGLRRTVEANQGWWPHVPKSSATSQFIYQPRSWEPPTTNGTTHERVIGHYQWTRGGLKGRDFDGPEIDTGQR